MSIRGVPVLMYHALSPGESREHYVVRNDIFRRHMDLLRQEGLRGVSLDYVLNHGDEVDHCVVLSFDDGHSSNYHHALPILESYGFLATFFITTGFIESADEWMSWDEVGKLAERGMDIQAHGQSHRFLDGLSGSELADELEGPVAVLEQKLGRRPYAVSFPGGRYTRNTLGVAEKAGYSVFCGSRPGLNRSSGDTSVFDRIVITQSTTEDRLRDIIRRRNASVFIPSLAYDVKRAVKKVIGNKVYHAIWSGLYKKGGQHGA